MYEMKIQVRYSEVDQSGVARLHQILEYFQDCGMFQSEELGLGVEEDQKNHRAWDTEATLYLMKRVKRLF